MEKFFLKRVALLGVVSFLTFSAGFAGALTPLPPDNTMPTISSLGIISVPFAQAGGNLTIYGTNFNMSSRVTIDGITIDLIGNPQNPTTWRNYNITASRIIVNIPRPNLTQKEGANITETSSFDLAVVNSNPAAGTSNTAQFLVVVGPNNPAPTITSIDPTSAYANGPAFTLTLAALLGN